MEKTRPKFRRRDGAGHLDPTYEAKLLAGSGSSREEEHAFLGRPWSTDPVAEELGGEFVVSVTTAHDDAQGLLDRTMPEEEGGPFVETSGKTEFGYD